MQIRVQNSKEFERLLEALASEIVEANIHFKLYRDLTSLTKDYAFEYNQSAAFWSLTFQAHLDVTLYRLCKIYDQHDTSLNLFNLLETIKGNLSLFNDTAFRERLKDNPFVESLSATSRKPDKKQLNDDLSYVSKDNHLIKKIIIWRGNVYAHKGTKKIIKGQKFSEEYPITLKEIDELLLKAKEIINRYSDLFRASTFSTQIIGQDDHKYVLESISMKLEYSKKYLKNQ